MIHQAHDIFREVEFALPLIGVLHGPRSVKNNQKIVHLRYILAAL